MVQHIPPASSDWSAGLPPMDLSSCSSWATALPDVFPSFRTTQHTLREQARRLVHGGADTGFLTRGYTSVRSSFKLRNSRRGIE